jgi:hypothetical protein
MIPLFKKLKQDRYSLTYENSTYGISDLATLKEKMTFFLKKTDAIFSLAGMKAVR